MDKFSFVKQLLENEKFTINQKERFFKLVYKELENSSKFDEQLLEDIKSIKQKIGLIDKKDAVVSDNISVTQINKKISYKNPSNLTVFLIEYNQHPVLKYTCHLIDSKEVIDDINKMCGIKEYEFSKHVDLIISSFNSFRKAHFIDLKIINLILVYLTGESYSKTIKVWSTDSIRYNWSSPELLKWSEDKPKIIPIPGLNISRLQNNKGFTFPGFKSNILGVRIRSFSELIIHFKNLFHIKGDNSLLKIIKNINEKNNWNAIIDFNINRGDFDETLFRENIELFTDVDGLRKGYVAVIKQVIEVANVDDKPIVNLIFKSENGKIEFSIHHINSVITKKSPEDFVSRFGESHNNIIENLNGICDLYLKAEFRYNKYCEINLWNGKDREVTNIDAFKGVEHILKFKK